MRDKLLKYCEVGDHYVSHLWHSRTKVRQSSCQSCAPKTPIKSKGTPIGNYTMVKSTVQAPKKQKPISKVSNKQKKLNGLYSVLKKQYMKDHPECEAKLSGCQFGARDIHHKFSGKDRSKYFLHTYTWASVCPNCHNIIHDVLSTEELINLNLRYIE